MRNKDNYIISLGNLCRWLAEQAQNLGVEIYPAIAAKEILFNQQDEVCGILTGEMGIAKDGSKKPTYVPAMELRATYTLCAEGARGSLSDQLIDRN